MRVLIFGTTWVDTPERMKLFQQWAKLHGSLNPHCDLLFVDSRSPLIWAASGNPFHGAIPEGVRGFSFPDNIGHLSHGGRARLGKGILRRSQTGDRS